MKYITHTCVLAGALLLNISSASYAGTGGEVFAQDKQNANVEIKIDNFSFMPPDLAIAVGTTVTWVNHDDIPHTVVSTDPGKTFKSKVLDTDEKFSFTFTKPGKIPYFCSIHPKMTATITVK
jgi:plastocyanin